MIKLGISGICGKMGQRILHLASQNQDLKVVLGLEAKGHALISKSLGEIKVSDDLSKIKEIDCLIEFSSPAATLEHIPYLRQFKKAVVIGTTGLDDKQRSELKQAAEDIPIVFSPNMSLGVNVLFRLLKKAASALRGYEVKVEEVHHIHKKDSPSGTAKKITEIINQEGFNLNSQDVKAERVDEVVGDHKVIFESKFDKLELFHSAKTRDIFAQGALLAAKWIVAKDVGLYSMDDLL